MRSSLKTNSFLDLHQEDSRCNYQLFQYYTVEYEHKTPVAKPTCSAQETIFESTLGLVTFNAEGLVAVIIG